MHIMIFQGYGGSVDEEQDSYTTIIGIIITKSINFYIIIR